MGVGRLEQRDITPLKGGCVWEQSYDEEEPLEDGHQALGGI